MQICNNNFTFLGKGNERGKSQCPPYETLLLYSSVFHYNSQCLFLSLYYSSGDKYKMKAEEEPGKGNVHIVLSWNHQSTQ